MDYRSSRQIQENYRVLGSSIGLEVSELRMAFYTRGREIDRDSCWVIELEFGDDKTIHFRYIEKMDVLKVNLGKWESPYNTFDIGAWEEVQEVGRPQMFRVCDQEPYCRVLGKTLLNASPIDFKDLDSVKLLYGYRLYFSNFTVDIHCSNGDVDMTASDCSSNTSRSDRCEVGGRLFSPHW